MTLVLTWLYLSLVAACVGDFIISNKKMPALSLFTGGLVIGIIGPPLIPMAIFWHLLKWMEDHR